MKTIKPILGLGLLCLLAASHGQAGAVGEDLLAIYALARSADPLLAGVSAQRGVQQEAATQARAALLPQWHLQIEQNRIDQAGSNGSAGHSLQASSRLSQVLLDIGQLRTLDAENTLLSAQDARLRAAEQDLCARVATAYFGVLSAQASLATTQDNESAFAAQVQQAQQRFQAGLSAQVDVDQARTYYELVRGNTVQAQQNLADARQALAQIIGREPGALKRLMNSLPASPPAPLDAQAWVERALAANPALQAGMLDLAASERRITAARAGHLPTLSLGLDSDRRRINTVGLKLSIPLFAGGATESQLRQASYRRDALQSETEGQRRSLIRETQAQYQAVLAALAQMQSAQAAVAAATQGLASTKAGQALGVRTMTDLLLAIQTQASAQNALDQARHRYVLAKLLLAQAAGGLDESELAGVNGWLQKDPGGQS